MEKKFKAIAKENLKREGMYEFEKGTVFKVTHMTKPLIEVEDFLGFRYWMKPELFELVDSK